MYRIHAAFESVVAQMGHFHLSHGIAYLLLCVPDYTVVRCIHDLMHSHRLRDQNAVVRIHLHGEFAELLLTVFEDESPLCGGHNERLSNLDFRPFLLPFRRWYHTTTLAGDNDYGSRLCSVLVHTGLIAQCSDFYCLLLQLPHGKPLHWIAVTELNSIDQRTQFIV